MTDNASVSRDGVSDREKLIREGFCFDSDRDCDAARYLLGVIDTIRGDRKRLRDAQESSEREIAELRKHKNIFEEAADVFASICKDLRSERDALRRQLAQATKDSERLCEAAELCRGATNRLLSILVMQAKLGHYPPELLGEGWQFAVDAMQEIRAAIDAARIAPDAEYAAQAPTGQPAAEQTIAALQFRCTKADQLISRLKPHVREMGRLIEDF